MCRQNVGIPNRFSSEMALTLINKKINDLETIFFSLFSNMYVNKWHTVSESRREIKGSVLQYVTALLANKVARRWLEFDSHITLLYVTKVSHLIKLRYFHLDRKNRSVKFLDFIPYKIFLISKLAVLKRQCHKRCIPDNHTGRQTRL
jgi:hypothetical protein